MKKTYQSPVLEAIHVETNPITQSLLIIESGEGEDWDVSQ